MKRPCNECKKSSLGYQERAFVCKKSEKYSSDYLNSLDGEQETDIGNCKIKVLFCIENYKHGGIPKALESLMFASMERFSKIGFFILVLFFLSKNDL